MDHTGSILFNILNNLEIPCLLFSYPDLRCVASNGAASTEFASLMLNYEDNGGGGIVGKTIGEIFSPSETASTIRGVLSRAGAGRKKLKLDDVLLMDSHGGAKLFNMTFIPLEDGGDAVKYLILTANDLSFRSKIAEQDKIILKAKEALKQKNHLLSILHMLPYGLIYITNDNIVHFVNESFLWLTSYEKDEIVGLHRDQAEKTLFRRDAGWGKTAPGGGGCGRSREDSICLVTKYNDVKPVEVRAIPLVKAGKVEGTVMAVREKTAELELDLTKSILKTILDSVLSVVLITDSDGIVLACSKSCLEILGLEEGELTGRSLKCIHGLLEMQSSDILYRTVRDKNYVHKTHATITTRSGIKKTLLLNNTPLFNKDGEFSGQVLVGSDITTFMERQERLMENERHAVIGQLTTGIAHEIKNPLTVISGFAEVTKSKILKISGNDSLKESMIYYQQEIIDNSHYMNRLIVDLLQLARPKKAEIAKINLCGTLDKICSTIAPYALQKNVTLVKNLGDADLEMALDPVQLGQILLNLCNNAIQSMKEGGTLAISTECSGGHLIIQISDTGCGIAPEDMGRLGTPFFTTKTEGTGLGLSITYSIIKDYGGKMEVESEVGRGTTFRVYLPFGT